MCEFKSFLILENSIYCPLDTDSHEEMISRLGLPDDGEHFVRAEAVPLDPYLNDFDICLIGAEFLPSWFEQSGGMKAYIVAEVKDAIRSAIVTSPSAFRNGIYISTADSPAFSATDCRIIFFGNKDGINVLGHSRVEVPIYKMASGKIALNGYSKLLIERDVECNFIANLAVSADGDSSIFSAVKLDKVRLYGRSYAYLRFGADKLTISGFANALTGFPPNSQMTVEVDGYGCVRIWGSIDRCRQMYEDGLIKVSGLGIASLGDGTTITGGGYNKVIRR